MQAQLQPGFAAVRRFQQVKFVLQSALPGSMYGVLRAVLFSMLPALAFALLLWLSDREREPWPWVLLTLLLGAVFGAGASWLEGRALEFTGLNWANTQLADTQTGAVVFLFGFAAPLREASKVAACWPAFRSKHFDEPYDGVVYAGTAGLGFAAADNALLLVAHPNSSLWVIRTLLALPAHAFFAATWGYALGRTSKKTDPGPLFPTTWLLAALVHGLYYLLCIRSDAGLVLGTLPILIMMGALTLMFGRDLRRRGAAGEMAKPAAPRRVGKLAQMRTALRDRSEPLRLWVVGIATLVTLGSMIAGFAAAIGFGHAAHVDFASVDIRDLGTTAPMALLGAGVLAAFPTSGFLLARSSARVSLMEPAMGAAMAIVVVLILLGASAPLALFVAIGFAPIAWALACAGAWIGRPSTQL